jgi:hypothetical protein
VEKGEFGTPLFPKPSSQRRSSPAAHVSTARILRKPGVADEIDNWIYHEKENDPCYKQAKQQRGENRRYAKENKVA